MSTFQKISDDIKTAMKSGDHLRKNVLRMMLSDIKYAQAAINVHQQLDEQGVIKVITTYHKKLKKAYEDFPEGDKRKELLSEIAIVEEYLPKLMDVTEIAKVIDEIMASTSSRNFGELMKLTLSRLGSTAAPKDVSEILKKKIG